MVDKILNGASNIISIYEFLKSKLQDDHSVFLRALKKTVKAVCKKMRDNLSFYPELAGSIPDDAEDVIFKKLMECIQEIKPFEPKDILPYDDIPKQVRDGLSKEILGNLNKSLVFFQKNYDAWSRQEILDISKTIDDLSVTMEELICKYYRYDSAKRYHEMPTNRSRFHYSNEKSQFKGMDIQRDLLLDFCICDNSSRTGKDFAWWVVTGEGGTGKSRLCLEFSKQMDQAGWSVCAQQNHSAEKLRQCSQSIISNTLFVLDYAEYDTGAIFNWIASFNAQQYNQIKICVLLIQRRGFWIDMREIINRKIISDGFVVASLYNEDFFQIEKLHPDETKNKSLLGEIQISYAKTERDISVTAEEIEALYRLLQKVDENFLRPLFAIVIADTYLENRNIPSTWSKKDVLDYICEREEHLILHITKEILVKSRKVV